ncbi:MAG: PQQ-like beta-propeller repeat protein [Candidatus Solibacter usitatus]|nr:PQQ-like beta-propeller repeat protein [Candidatus Solibacter usitatus]
MDKPLRLWPGVIAIVLLLLSRFAVKAVIPGFGGFMWAIQGSLACAVVVILWWLFLSRARWLDRIGVIVLIAAGLGSAWLLKHESMGPAWIFAYAAPFALAAFVGAAFAARNLGNFRRRLIIAAAILAGTLGWTLVRSEGIDGDHALTFAWRWSTSAEQLLLAKPVAAPAVEPAIPKTVAPAEKPKPAAVAAEWPGFRGPKRDSVVPGVVIATSWSQTPPVEVWRKPVGPGWSSFAVQGGLIYTQEQRGEEELVTAYQTLSGNLVWRHADTVRFFESNAGAGPRATPALANGRVFSLGATGILNVLDAATGERSWSRNTTADTKRRIPDWGFSASPIVTQDLVIVYAGRLAAYEAATGKLMWTGESVGGSYSSPHLATIGGVEQLLIVTPGGIAGLDPATGVRMWSHEWKGLPIIQPTLIPGGGILISASATDGTRRIDPARGPNGWTIDTRWTSLALKPYFNDTVIHKGYAYGFDARILTCIDLNDGKRVWKGGRYGNGQMLLLSDQDLLLILSEDGELALVRASPSGFTEIAKVAALEGKTWNHPVLAAGLLLVRNDREMAAFRLPK